MFRRTIVALCAAVLLLTGVAGTTVHAAQDNAAICAAVASQQAQIDAQEAQFFAALASGRAQLDAYEATYIPLYNSLITAYAAYPDIVAQYTAARDSLIQTIADSRAYYDAKEAEFTAYVTATKAALAAVAVAYNCA